MDEDKKVKLGELISKHAGASIVFSTTDAAGVPIQIPISGAQFSEDLDGNQVITLW